MRGQEAAKRALEVAAAGGHNLLFIGPPGSGKTMLARRLPGLLPPLTLAEAIEVTKIHSLAAERPPAGLVRTRPFRSPHPGVSTAGMVGGGSVPRPGEASLAHNGVLFLDEFPEFRRDTLEALRQPLEEGAITVVRARARFEFPARFALMAAMNPCPCGHLGDPRYDCRCPPPLVERYRGRVSGPLLDRIDLHVEVPAVSLGELRGRAAKPPPPWPPGSPGARAPAPRFGPGPPSRSTPPWDRKSCAATAPSTPPGGASSKPPSSASASPPARWTGCCSVARTIADFAGAERSPRPCRRSDPVPSLDRRIEG